MSYGLFIYKFNLLNCDIWDAFFGIFRCFSVHRNEFLHDFEYIWKFHKTLHNTPTVFDWCKQKKQQTHIVLLSGRWRLSKQFTSFHFDISIDILFELHLALRTHLFQWLESTLGTVVGWIGAETGCIQFQTNFITLGTADQV